MSQNINKTMRHLKFCYISILTNLLRSDPSKHFVIQLVTILHLMSQVRIW